MKRKCMNCMNTFCNIQHKLFSCIKWKQKIYRVVKFRNKAVEVALFNEKGNLQTKANLTAYLCAC